MFDQRERVAHGERRDDVAFGEVERVPARPDPTIEESSLAKPAWRYRSWSAATPGSTSSLSPCRAASSIMRRASLRAMLSSKLGGENVPSAIALPRPCTALPGLNSVNSEYTSFGSMPRERPNL